jgi:hypothetical protein
MFFNPPQPSTSPAEVWQPCLTQGFVLLWAGQDGGKCRAGVACSIACCVFPSILLGLDAPAVPAACIACTICVVWCLGGHQALWKLVFSGPQVVRNWTLSPSEVTSIAVLRDPALNVIHFFSNGNQVS